MGSRHRWLIACVALLMTFMLITGAANNPADDLPKPWEVKYGPVSWGPVVEGLQLGLAKVQTEPGEHARGMVVIILRNVLAANVMVKSAGAQFDYGFALKDAYGKAVPVTAKGKAWFGERLHGGPFHTSGLE